MNEIMERMYKAAFLLKGIHGPTAIGKLIGVKPQTVSNWERRGPSRAGLILAHKKIGCYIGWLEAGHGEMSNSTLVTILNPPQSTAPLTTLERLRSGTKSILNNPMLHRVEITCSHKGNFFAVKSVDRINEPAIPWGSYVVFEATEEGVAKVVENGKWCVVSEPEKDPIISQVYKHGGKIYLKTGSPEYPHAEMAENGVILGIAKEMITPL